MKCFLNMKIIIEDTFYSRLYNQVDYISLDSKRAAQRFKNDVLNQLKRIPRNPYQFRKSIFFDDIQVRDLIYKGYTITFRINGDRIEIFGFTRYQQNVTD